MTVDVPQAPSIMAPCRTSCGLRTALFSFWSVSSRWQVRTHQSRRPAREHNTATAVSAVESLPTGEVIRRWESSAGNVLLIRDDSLVRAIYPTVRSSTRPRSLDEGSSGLRRGGGCDGGERRLRAYRGSRRSMRSAPCGQHVAMSADSTRPWTVAFQRGVATPLVLRPIESLSSSDSARLAAQLTRLAASLPNDTSRAFRGLPFVIRTAQRFTPEGTVESVVAEIVRRVNVEANPREETLLLMAEREDPASEWRVTYSERASGDELHVERAMPLAAVKLGRRSADADNRANRRGLVSSPSYRPPDGTWRQSWERLLVAERRLTCLPWSPRPSAPLEDIRHDALKQASEAVGSEEVKRCVAGDPEREHRGEEREARPPPPDGHDTEGNEAYYGL